VVENKLLLRQLPDEFRANRQLVVEALEVFNQRGETVLACEHLLPAERRKV
jgi:hypothetical protein